MLGQLSPDEHVRALFLAVFCLATSVALSVSVGKKKTECQAGKWRWRRASRLL